MRSTDEAYESLAYDGAPLLRVPLCVSRTFLVPVGMAYNDNCYVYKCVYIAIFCVQVAVQHV